MGWTVSTIKRVPGGFAFNVVLESAVLTFTLNEYLVAEAQSDPMRDLIEVAKEIQVLK